jgi:hypothetical protein
MPNLQGSIVRQWSRQEFSHIDIFNVIDKDETDLKLIRHQMYCKYEIISVWISGY